MLVVVLAGGPASARGDSDIFTVVGLPVDAEAETAAKARDVALARGQVEAFRRILRRLTSRADAPNLPKRELSGIVEMVGALEVGDERTSATRYLADLTVSFKPQAIREVLRGAAIPFTETRARPVLVLPVLEAGDSPRLFDEDNPWLEAWALHERDRGAMLPLLPPIGDLEDITTIDARRAVAGDAGALAAISARHGVGTQLVAIARRGGKASGGAVRPINVTLAWHGALRRDVEVRPFAPVKGEDEAAMMARVVAVIAADLEEAWKQETLLRFDEEYRLSAHVPITSLAQWVAVRDSLERNAMIKRFDLLAISKTGAQVELHYLGTPDRLGVSLAQDGLTLTRDDDAFWTLWATDGARARE